EFETAVAIIGHDRVHDKGDLLADRTELILGRVVLEFRSTQPVLDERHWGGPVTQPEVGERRSRGHHVERRDLVAAQGETHAVKAVWFVEARDTHASGRVQDRGDADGQLGFDRWDI